MKSRITAFQWDKSNIDKNFKNLLKHGINDQECEEVFFDFNKKILKDVLHSGKEERYIAIGKTKKERLLFIVFTVRGNKIRIISARNLNKKEKHLYEKRT